MILRALVWVNTIRHPNKRREKANSPQALTSPRAKRKRRASPGPRVGVVSIVPSYELLHESHAGAGSAVGYRPWTIDYGLWTMERRQGN
jgi:hypothetical protein